MILSHYGIHAGKMTARTRHRNTDFPKTSHKIHISIIVGCAFCGATPDADKCQKKKKVKDPTSVLPENSVPGRGWNYGVPYN